MREYEACKLLWICEKGDILRNQVIVGSDSSKIKTHMISPIKGHSVGNIIFCFLYADSIIRIGNLLSVSSFPVTNTVDMWQ
jgi:hypothetical protein